MTIQVDSFLPFASESGYLSLRLGKSHPDEVGTITFQSLGSFGLDYRIEFIHSSLNGVGRTFYMREPHTLAALEYDVRADGHSGNPPVAKVIEYPSILRLPSRHEVLDYDPYSGRICLLHGGTRDTAIEVLDLVV